MTELEIYKACCGATEEGESNAICVLKHSLINSNDETIVKEVVSNTAIVKIHKGYKFTTIDLEFNSLTEYDYIHFLKLLNNFTKTENSFETEENIPALILTIVAKEIENYFICGVHGAWCLINSSLTNKNTTIRFIFENECISAYELAIPEDKLNELKTEVFMESEYGEGGNF